MFDGIVIKRLDVDYGYKYSMSFGQRLMRFDGIIVRYLDRGSNNFMKIMPMGQGININKLCSWDRTNNVM
jgi:hypothetical protein